MSDMAAIKKCKHQGFSYATNRYKNIRIICDLTGKIYDKEYCRKCNNYDSRLLKKGGAE